MKTAEEMFKKLKYEICTLDDNCLCYNAKINNERVNIVFNFKNKTVDKYKTWGNLSLIHSSITLKELAAINKQCEELGWIN